MDNRQKSILYALAGSIVVAFLAKKFILTPGTMHSGEVLDLKSPMGGGSKFPLRKGSTGEKVRELQLAIGSNMLPKYGADGDFGDETESAVMNVLRKKQVDSQSEITAILAKREAAEFKANGLKRADEILKACSQNKSLNLMFSKNTLAQAYTADSFGAMKFDTEKNLMFKSNVKFAQDVLKPIGKTVSGYLQVKYRGNTYRVSSLDIMLLEGPKIVPIPMAVNPSYTAYNE